MAPDRADLAVSTAAYDGHGWEAAFASLARLGVRLAEPAFIDGYVQFSEADFTPDKAAAMRRQMALQGLRSDAVSAHVDMGAPDAAAKLSRRIAFAADLGARAVITNAASEDRAGQFRRTLDAVLPECERSGITLRLENPGHGQGNLLPTGAAGARLLREIGAEALGLNYDVGNAWSYNLGRIDLGADLEAALGAGASLHLKDLRAAGGDWRFCAIGSGSVDYAMVRRRLAGAGGGYRCLELPLRLQRPGRGDPVRQDKPLDLPEIERAIGESLDYLCDTKSA